MIVLDENYRIGHGQVRSCYLHPQDEGLVIKVAAGPHKEQLQANSKEMRGYHFLLARHGRLDCISHCHGFVATNLGEGLVCDCIRDADGSISQTISNIVHSSQPYDIEEILAVTKQFGAELARQDIWLFDLNLHNIVLARQQDNRYRPLVIDLKGRYDNKEFLPLSSYIGFLARKKRERRVRQLIDRISRFTGGVNP